MHKFWPFILLALFTWVTADQLPGVLQLDSLSFNKTLRAFPFSVIKFDIGNPHGDKHNAWKDFGHDLAQVPELLVGEVRIKDQGTNQDLAKRFGLEDEQTLPEVIFFRRKGPKHEETRFGGEFDADNLLIFVQQKTSLYLNLPGTLREFDPLARWMMTAKDDKDRQKAIAKAEEKAKASGWSAEDRVKATKYIKLMKLVAEDGFGALKAEEDRVNKLMKEKMSDKKKDELKRTLNVIRSFTKDDKNKQNDKDEL